MVFFPLGYRATYVVVGYLRSGETYNQSMPRNILEDRRPQLHRGGNLK
jgi:hypothetical protein